MNASIRYDPKELAKALIGLSRPDTPSGPFRNRRSLFVEKDESISIVQQSTELDTIPGFPTADRSAPVENKSKRSVGRHSTDRSIVTQATRSLLHTSNRVSVSEADNTSAYAIRTPRVKRSFSKHSYYSHTDPGIAKSSKRLDPDSKKRRVSFHPSHGVADYEESAQVDPYLLPLNDTLTDNPNTYADTIVPQMNSVSIEEDPVPVLFEIYPEDREDLFEQRSDGGVSGPLVPQQIKEQLTKLVAGNKAPKQTARKSVVTEYAALRTPIKLSPVKYKLSFPPLSLDPLHPTLHYPRKKGPKQPPVIKLCIERDDAFIPTSFFKNWYTKTTHNSFLPASTTQWLQDYSTGLIDHFLKLVRARCEHKKQKNGYLATEQDMVAVMREFLELDESINVNNLIHTYLPMELWFTYLP